MLPIIVKRFRDTSRELRHHSEENEEGRKSIYR
jgi:hypothetical protein